MSSKHHDINSKLRIDQNIMREGADIDVLTDDFEPLSNLFKSLVKLVSVFLASFAIPALVSTLLTDPNEVGIKPTDGFIASTVKIANTYSDVEFAWGCLIGITLMTIVIAFTLQLYKYRRRNGWTTVASPTELEKLFSIRPICGIPDFGKYETAKSQIESNSSAFSESLNTLLTQLEGYFGDSVPSVIQVTSAKEGEGKSTLALGIACTLAKTSRVLLIDADLRRPGLSNMMRYDFKIDVKSDFIDDFIDGREVAIYKIADTSVDLMLRRATSYVDPNYALRSLPRLLNEFNHKYDHIIIDSPPVLGLADAIRIRGCTELTLFAIEANNTWVYAALDSIRKLGPKFNVIPVVTKIKYKPVMLYYSYSYGSYNT